MSLPNTIRRLSATLFCFLTAVAGCNRPGMPFGRDSSAPTADRLVAAYEDLRPAKFQIIADFETPIQGSLFRLEPQRGLGGVEISTQQARPETGVGALRMTLTDSWQHVVAEDRAESEWALPRDWTPYHLLIFSVYSPRPLSGFLFSVRSGTDIPLAYTHPRTSLAQGWNLIRIDLGNLANQVNLADVREMRFWCDPLESPVDLYLDDLVLVNNVKQLFGPTELTPGDLYARSEGRRLVVGAAERFELVFSQGLISQWFDLSSDPAKTRSLTGEQPPVRQWLYTIRRDGRVYIECTGTTGEVDVITTAVSFCLDGDAGFQPTVVARSAEAAPGGAHDPYALFSREERGRADLLVVPFGQVIGQMLRRPDDPRLCVLWRLPPGDTRFSFAAMMRVWPTDIDSAAQAAPMAADYRHPTPLLVDVGSLVRTDPGDFDGDGFSEGRGYYVLQLDNKAADVRISGRRYLRFSPAFKLVNARDRDVWVYVDGKQIETYRDREGDILFEVKGMISNEALVEVRSRVREAQ